MAQDTNNGVATSDAKEPIPDGKSASNASQCEGVRVDEKVAVNCWKEEASGVLSFSPLVASRSMH